ncbi:hypothetical protein F5Y17DRAFT_113823 [Xylariaceae sp. FL0594]|nr:hypothetical protein F5Y17DRAFT_113823 [Xylariaceae sp. FL0594]
MLSLQQHIEIESARWAALSSSSRRGRDTEEEDDEESVITSSSSNSSVFSRSSPPSSSAAYKSELESTSQSTSTTTGGWKRIRSKYHTHRLSRRSSTSSFATEIEAQEERGEGEGGFLFVVPRDVNGEPITVYASLEAAVAQSLERVAYSSSVGPGQDGGGGVVGEQQEEQPRRLVTPGKLYENEEDDDEIVYE